MVAIWENFFNYFIDFAADILTALGNILPGYIDLTKSINLYLFSDNLIISFTLQEIIFWLLFIGLLVFVFGVFSKIIKAPLKFWLGGKL